MEAYTLPKKLIKITGRLAKQVWEVVRNDNIPRKKIPGIPGRDYCGVDYGFHVPENQLYDYILYVTQYANYPID